MLMTLNQHELWDMQSYAESLGVAFRFDPLINNTLGGAHSPQTYRLPPQEVVQFDRADRRRWDDLRVFYERMPEMRIDDTYLYACGAGINSFHIDPYGKLYLCMMSRTQGYDLREGSFQEGWANYLPQVRLQPHGESYECNRCKLLPLCGQCPSWGTLENGDPEYKVEYLCQIAHQRAAAFESTSR
jgi:radical SAM protein with 4Fe4S-binding SPASM domain